MEKLKQNTSRLHWWKRGEIKVRGEESGERENRKKKTLIDGEGASSDISEFQSVRNVEGHPSRGKRAVSNIVRGCQKATEEG